MKKKAKKQRERLMDVLAIIAFVMQAVEFGIEVWSRRKASQHTRVPTAKRAV